MEKPGWINDLFRSRWERQGWIQLRKGDFQAGDDEGSETWQWVGWNIKLAWQTNILNGRANAKLWNFRISKHATIIKATAPFLSCPTMLPDVGHKIDMVLHHHVTNKVSDATRLPTAPLLFCPTLFPAVQHTFVTQGWNMLKDWDKTRGEDEKRKRKAKNKVPRSKKDKK